MSREPHRTDNSHQNQSGRNKRVPRHLATILLLGVVAVLVLLIAMPSFMEKPLDESLYQGISPETFDTIRQITSGIQEKQQRWRAGITGISHLSPAEFEQMLGGHVPADLATDFELSYPGYTSETGLQITQGTVSAIDLPAKWDWRLQGKVSTAKHQGSCGSCWAFAAAGALESVLMIYDDRDINISEQQAINCNYDSYGCDGGWMTSAYRIWRDKGAFLDQDFPYTKDDSDPCQLEGYDPVTTVSGWVSVPANQEMLKRALLVSPLATGFHAYSDFQHYRDGVYEHEGSDRINHAVLLVGWDDELGAWIIKNSWGGGWGIGGFAYIAYDCCQVGRYTHRVQAPATSPVMIHHAALTDTLAADEELELEVIIASLDEPLDIQNMRVYVDTGFGYSDYLMTRLGGDLFSSTYKKTLSPYSVGTHISYYFESTGTNGISKQSPASGPAAPYSFRIMRTVCGTSFEESGDWLSGDELDTATDGSWEWGIPSPTIGVLGDFVQPDADHSDNDLYCFVTGASAGSDANDNDVDDGFTTLLSPLFDLANLDDARVLFWLWFANHWGHYPWEDPFTVEASNDNGINWTPLLYTQMGDSKWQRISIDLEEYLPLTETVRLRFTVTDSIHDSLVEAAIDDFSIITSTPLDTGVDDDDIPDPLDPAPGTSTQLSFTLGPNPTSGGTEIRLNLPQADNVRIDLFDAAGRRVRTICNEKLSAGEHNIHWDGNDERGQSAPSGRYWTRLYSRGRQINRSLIVIR